MKKVQIKIRAYKVIEMVNVRGKKMDTDMRDLLIALHNSHPESRTWIVLPRPPH